MNHTTPCCTYIIGPHSLLGPRSILPRRYPKTLHDALEHWQPGLQAVRYIERPAHGQEWERPPGLSGFSRLCGIWGGGPPGYGGHPATGRFVANYVYGFSGMFRN